MKKTRRPPRLKDGEFRTIKPKDYSAKKGLEVVAHRVDCDTPYVILKYEGKEIWLEDISADELCRCIKAALDVLPTSK